MFNLFERLHNFIKHSVNRRKQYGFFSSYLFNYGRFSKKKYYTHNIFYVDNGVFLFNSYYSKKHYKTRFFNFFRRKRIYFLVSKLRTLKLLKYKVFPQIQKNKSITYGKFRK